MQVSAGSLTLNRICLAAETRYGTALGFRKRCTFSVSIGLLSRLSLKTVGYLSRICRRVDVVTEWTVWGKCSSMTSRKLPPHRKATDARQTGQVRVCFEETHERDAVMSFASSLSGNASIQAVIPEHLTPLQRHLESFAFRIRKNARSRETKISTSVRLHDEEMSLILAIKSEGSRKWSYHTKEELLKNDEKNKKLIQKAKSKKA